MLKLNASEIFWSIEQRLHQFKYKIKKNVAHFLSPLLSRVLYILSKLVKRANPLDNCIAT